VWRSLGLYTLCGENESDLARRFERLVEQSPKGVLDGMTLSQWREGRLVGTPEQIREQLETWSSLGVETVICGMGSVPFHVGSLNDVELMAETLRSLTGNPRG
jgi:alkanesulfonate monooxygenase SsuD/methylene tetrahydromethanopterin reductase-like flavin-dependent oxidoreductase (luciferase family)